MSKKKYENENHHRPPQTRREFLAQGILAFSAMSTLPDLLGFSLRSAYGADCAGSAGTPSGIPFMAFDMAGGSAMPGNFLVGKKGGPEDFLKSYDRLGWNPQEAGALNKDFGLPMSAKYSKILEGILATASADARKNLRMGSFCHFSQDDVSSNKLNAGSLVLRAGQSGQFIGNGLGVVRSNSGGNSDSAFADLALKPTFVGDIGDVLGATKFGGGPFATMKSEQVKALASGAARLGKFQADAFAGQPNAKILQELSECAYKKSLDFVDGVKGLDPRTDTVVAPIYALNQNTPSGDINAITAALAMNTLRGNSGPSVYTLGGCDYHTGSQAPGDAKDREMGVHIGRAVEAAFRLKKPFFFQLITDGGVDASPGTRNWRGDSGDKGMTVIGFFHPDKAPTIKRQQVGFYTDGQGAERETLIGANPQLVAYAVFANYLNVMGMKDKFSQYVPGVFTNQGELDSVLIFEGKV